MSCEIKLLSKVVDLKRVQELFGLKLDDDWLNAVHYSISPTLEIIAFGHGTKLVILGQNWDKELQQNIFSITWTGDLENLNDIITSILCLPIIRQSSLTQSTPEWTGIAIGLTSGLVLFYTDSGFQIFSQAWHNETIFSIKAQSGKKIAEELHIAYASCVCIIQGVHLFQVLNSMRQQYFKTVNINKNDLSPIQDTVPCRKWGHGGKTQTISDIVVAGPQRSCDFDHLLTATLEGGFYAKYRSSPPQNSLVMISGNKPYVGFHYAKEGFVQPVLADVARAVASKIKSALPSWLGGANQKTQLEAPPPPQPAEVMICRFGLCDHQRNAMNIYLAPGNELAAVTDNLGRVILVDCIRAIALRVWKGYREAQCSFIEVTEKNVVQKSSKKQDRRHALFLIIFAPRRSCLEIWPLQRGGKVAAFNVSKYGQLIYNPYGLMGTVPGSKIKYNSHTCCFFDPSDETIKEIQIPFHCAISDSNSKTAKDLHILRRIKLCLKCDEDGTDEQIINEIEIMCSNLQTNEIRLLCLEMMIKNQKLKPIFLSTAIKIIENQIKTNENIVQDDAMDVQENTEDSVENVLERSESEITPQLQHYQILNLCQNYMKLIIFYNYVTDQIQNDTDTTKSSSKYEKMSVSSNELNNIQKLLDLLSFEKSQQPETPKVTFQETKNKIEFVNFLTTFIVQNENFITLNEKKDEHFSLVGSIIYSKFLEKGKSLDKFLFHANQCGILSEDFIKLLLYYWLDKPFLYTKSEELILDMTRFNGILQNICLLAGNIVEYEYGSISPWWQSLRELLLESPCALRGLLAAMMCRNHAIKCSMKEKVLQDSPDDDMNFEELSQEACEWTLLIGKLDDIAVLGAILNLSLQDENPTLPILKYEKPAISLKSTLSGGKGIVSELVAKWICATGINPENILETESMEINIDTGAGSSNSKHTSNIKKYYEKYPLSKHEVLLDNDDITASDVSKEKKETPSDFNPILSNLNLLRDHFPFSLQSGVLLTHMTWEYMCYWSKHLSNLSMLSAGLKCLSTIKQDNYALKHGLCCMLWNAHLKIPMEATKKLINKVGRLPKEKLCLQDIGISDSLVPEFLENCLVFLENFRKSLIHEKIQLNYEETLQDGPVPLAQLTLQQNLANLQLLELHVELTMVLNLISFFNIKSTKPKHLFDGLANQSFFSEINRALPYSLPKADLILQNVRMKFLSKIITESIDLIREDFEQIYLNDHILWMEKIEHLAVKWELDVAELRRHQIIELYTFGWDSYANELLENLSQKSNISSSLLRVAGTRINYFIKNNPSAWSHVVAIGPLLTDYLDSLADYEAEDDMNRQINQNNFTKNQLTDLTARAFKCVSETDTKDLRIAGLLVDACATIRELT